MINHLTIILLMTLLFFQKSDAQEIQSRNFSDCGLDQHSIMLSKLIIESENQQRNALICNPKLAKAAHAKAKLMAKADAVSHRIDHITPNQFLRSYGIKLPKKYPLFDNQVEAIMGAVATPQESFDVFMTSPDHKAHLLGEYDFVLEQDQIGVGFYKDSDTTHVYYWVIYITKIVSPKK